MFTQEQIQEAINDKLTEVEQIFGEEASVWYRVGFMECVQFMIDMNKLFIAESEIEKISNLNQGYPTTGGIN